MYFVANAILEGKALFVTKYLPALSNLSVSLKVSRYTRTHFIGEQIGNIRKSKVSGQFAN